MPVDQTRQMTMAFVGEGLSPLFPNNPLHLYRLVGREAMSQLFHFDAFFSTSGPVIPFDQVLGMPVQVALPAGDGVRYVHGICSSFGQVQDGNRTPSYRASIVPRVWLLTRRVQSRVFENKDLPTILEEVFSTAGFVVGGNCEVFISKFQRPHRRHEYCVQYRESDFHFVSRLLEEEGVHYFFRHAENFHQMIIADGMSDRLHTKLDGTIRLGDPVKDAGAQAEEVVYGWHKDQTLCPARYRLRDHHFALSNPILESTGEVARSVNVGKVAHALSIGRTAQVMEVADYPGDYNHRFDVVDLNGADQANGLDGIYDEKDAVAKTRVQQEAVQGLTVEASGDNPAFAAGCQVVVSEPEEDAGPYLLVSVSHAAQQGGDRSGDGTFRYTNSFQGMPFAIDFPYMPPRLTRRPMVAGSQTALVVGIEPDGKDKEEIFTDKFGRVKVQFHWDRINQWEPKSSCWVRVATPWAGQHWGMIHLPRVGQEVVVTFLDGNLDQPLIVGSVYNANQPPPWDPCSTGF